MKAKFDERHMRLMAASYGNVRGAAANVYAAATKQRLEHYVDCLKQLGSDQEFLGVEMVPRDELDANLRWCADMLTRVEA